LDRMSRKTTNIFLIVFAVCTFFYGCSFQNKEEQLSEAHVGMDTVAIASDSIDQVTGLVVDEELPLVVANCTACHSAKLITQNRATREGWKNMVVWMQETQNLWDLGPHEDKILDYLARHYAPEQTGRRKNLENIDWYDLKESEQN
jgi:hypothetical protein